MSANLVAVLFGVVTAVGYGLADFWGARASKKIGPITALLAIDVLMLATYLPLYFLLPDAGRPLTSSGVGFAVLGSVLLNTASILFFKGLALGPVSIVSPLSAAYPLVSAVLAVGVFGARLSPLQLAAIVVIVISVMIANGLFSPKTGGRRLGRGPLLATISAVFYGASFSCLAQASQRIGWQTTSLIEFTVLVIVIALSVPLVRGREVVFGNLGKALTNGFVIIGGLTAVATIAIFNMGFTHEQASGAILIAVSACYPIITAGLALKHFKEEVHLAPLIGAAASVAGIVLLSLG
ncbi:MAG TPA: EamA family transporter [Candidatus Pristimantibacillus sp.]|nr:EamA family transporter [Candidatus Pristimantibacillus sp.]